MVPHFRGMRPILGADSPVGLAGSRVSRSIITELVETAAFQKIGGQPRLFDRNTVQRFPWCHRSALGCVWAQSELDPSRTTYKSGLAGNRIENQSQLRRF